jgi:hypothetical protein
LLLLILQNLNYGEIVTLMLACKPFAQAIINDAEYLRVAQRTEAKHAAKGCWVYMMTTNEWWTCPSALACKNISCWGFKHYKILWAWHQRVQAEYEQRQLAAAGNTVAQITMGEDENENETEAENAN